MKISEQWLREWVNPPVSTEQLADQLTMAGLEVEALETILINLNGVIVAEVTSVDAHPDATSLKLCRVSTGNGKHLDVVCGADNVRKGMRVPLATVGTTLPNGNTISESRIRGVTSQGMLCSAEELGLADESAGLLEISVDVPVGQSLADIMGNNDSVLDIALTPNRGDCLSIQGIAREVAVINQCSMTAREISLVKAVSQDTRKVHLDAGAACPHYAGRRITGVTCSRPTPLWLQEKLLRCGIRSINPVVDITNYVMLESGQPMHAFDDEKLHGDIHVRFAKKGEKLTLLDEQTCEFSDDVLLITDSKRPLAMAGIMGGMDSAVTENTSNIFLESAWFDPLSISGIARRYGLHTDSSHRFERGVDYTQQVAAIEHATRLILDICGGEPGPVTESQKADDLPVREAIRLRTSSIEQLLGVHVAASDVNAILKSLGMQVEQHNNDWLVTPPPRRFDLSIETDLVEEIARIIGYDNIPEQSPVADLRMFADNETHALLEKVRFLLVNRGYQEAITYSFVDEKLQQLLYPDEHGIVLANPITADLSVMRTNLWAGLITALQHNVNRQQSRVRLFESGLVFRKSGTKISQYPVISGIIYGNTYQKQWDIKDDDSDFFDLKCDVEEILSAAGLAKYAVTFQSSPQNALHPAQSAEIIYNNQVIGKLGALHPALQNTLELAKPVYLFELEISRFSQQITPEYQKISKFPAVKRDIAIVVDESVSVAELETCIRKTASNYLVNLELFDVYQGEGIDLGKKSLAIGLTFQGSSSTLTDEEVEAIMGDILVHLESGPGAILRE